MARVSWTSEAERWLREIYRYIARDDVNAAQQVIAGIYKKTSILTDFPKIGYKYRTEPEGDIRILLYGHYRIVYLIREHDEICILGVFHGAMQIDKYLDILT